MDIFLDSSDKYESPFNWPEDAKQFLEKSKIETCKVQRFSDGVMVYVPLGHTGESFPVSSVMTALLCTASTMMVSLAKKTPIRMGIAIGGAVELEDGELFGPAIGHAHEMESKRAIYPRIAVHENVIAYLMSYDDLRATRASSVDDRYQYDIAKLCASTIIRDDDGVYILDYLGDTAWEHIFQGGDNELLELAFDFVKCELSRFEKEGNGKLVKKYSYLHKYFANSKAVTNIT